MTSSATHALADPPRVRRCDGGLPRRVRAYGGRGGGFAIATEGTTDVAAYLESSVHGVTVTDATMITRAVRVFDALRTDALSWTATLDLLHKAVERWNT